MNLISNIRDYLSRSFKKKLLLYLVSYVLLFIISFVSWNYFGLLFLINGIFLFAILDNFINRSFFIYITHITLFLLSWMIAALSWMFKIDQGIYGLLIVIILSIIPFIILYILKKIFKGTKVFYIIPIWILYEVFHNFSSISFPWLTLGNVFSTNTFLIQWYKYTGVLGGSLWFLLICYFSYCSLKKDSSNYNYLKFVLITFIPLSLISLFILYSDSTTEDAILKDKTYITFNNDKVSNSLQGKDLAFYILKKTRDLKAKNKVLIIPEATFTGLNIDKYQYNLIYNFLAKIITENGFKEVYFGTSMYKSKQYITNGSVMITEKKHYTKTKEKLIIFNEYVPRSISTILSKKKFNPNAQDTSDEIINDLKILPIICYEAFYSYYLLKKNKKAKIIYLISSEKFFNNSFWGSKQYNNILKLRCIENQIPLIKSSYNGSSLVINSKGKILFNSDEEINIYHYD